MPISATRIFMFLAIGVGVGIWGLSILAVISSFRRGRRRVRELEASAPLPPLPVPAFVLHLVPLLLIGGMIAHAFQGGHGDDAGPLCAAAGAFVIIQLVAAGMIGLGKSLFSVACTSIFVFVEVAIAVAIYAATQA